MRSLTLRRLAVVVGAVLVLAAAVVFFVVVRLWPATVDTDSPRDGALVAIATAEPAPPMSPCSMALIEGTLVADERTGLAIRIDGFGVQPTLWPHGYVGRISGGGVELLNPAGRVIGRTGDHITAAGGATSVDGMDVVHACAHIELIPGRP